jgi:L-alanine-DL-glutamate epimerase-like enolase superfamily enzyme
VRISDIEAITLRYSYPAQDRFQYAGGICDGRLTTLILVHCDNGEVGIGSVYSHPSLIYLVVRDQLAPLLRGEDPTEVEALWDKMYALTRWYGRKGAAMSALGGVDTALWDLRGKALEEPVWRLLGGTDGRCMAYASGLLWSDDLTILGREAASYIERGFRRVKMRLARSETYDTEALLAVRKAIGTDHDVIVDASMRYHPDLAVRMGKLFTDQRVFWYEEPFAPESLDAFAILRAAVGVPVAAGENEFGVQGFRELIRTGAVDVVQPDASRCGGISEVVRVGRLAHEHGLRFATHSWSDAVAIVANAHVVSAVPSGVTVEIDQMNNPFVDELLDPEAGTNLAVLDGQISLGDSPGLGIRLNTEVVDRYRLQDPLVIPDGVYSDMMFGPDNFPRVLPYVEGTRER